MVQHQYKDVQKSPAVTVVIPHWKGEDILRHTLESVEKTNYTNLDVIIVNNNSPDGSIEAVKPDFAEFKFIDSEVNLGFAAGCNLGISAAHTKYIALLNNDTEVTPNWLANPIGLLEEDELIAAVQPKLLWFYNRNNFDYSGGAGGQIDIFGYPFTLGRIFDFIEKDTGQYNLQREVFWASGAAVVIRNAALNHAGLLDETFFAHMEEIDLEWRFHLAGYKVVNCPDSVVYHRSGATLEKENVRKMMLNHRNSIVMILKNYQLETLFWFLPIRMFFEMLTILFGAVALQPKRSLAVICSFWGIIGFIPHIIKDRKKIQAIRKIPDRKIMHKMYRGSIVLDYFIRGKRKASEII